MVFILLTRKSYHCLHRCLDFDPKSKSFKGDLKFGYQDFSVKFNNCFETSYDQWFSVLWRHTASWSVLCKWSYFYNIFLILDFSQGCISFGDMPCAFIHFFFTRHKTKTRKEYAILQKRKQDFLKLRQEKMVWESLCHFPSCWRKEMSVFIFLLRLLWSEEESPAPSLDGIWMWWFWAVLGTFGWFRSPLIPTHVHPLFLHTSIKRVNWALLCCSYFMILLTRKFQKKI